VRAEWKNIYRSMMKIALTVERIPGVRRYVSIQGLLRMASIILNFSALSVPIFNAIRGLPTSIWLPTALALCGAGMLVASWAMGRNVALEIDRYFRAHGEKYRFVRAYLARVNQKLINSLRRHLRSSGEDPAKYRLKLFNVDYKGIKVLKEPSFFRKRYVVSVVI